MAEYAIYADGACSGNPGPGGWGFEIWKDGEVIACDSGSSAATTNNIMELQAAIAAVYSLLHGGFPVGRVLLKLDSEYVLKGLFDWMPGWKARGWKTSGKKPVANAGLWQELDLLVSGARAQGWEFEPSWVKGHDGDEGNERVDALAVARRDEARSSVSLEPSEVSKTASSPSSDVRSDITPEQVTHLRQILDGYVSGEHSVRSALLALRANSDLLGL